MTTPMTPPPAVFGQFGQALAFAERTLSATLREHLAERDTQPETWYALQLIATRGPGVSRQGLSEGREGSTTLTADPPPGLRAGLKAQGLIHGNPTST